MAGPVSVASLRAGVFQIGRPHIRGQAVLIQIAGQHFPFGEGADVIGVNSRLGATSVRPNAGNCGA